MIPNYKRSKFKDYLIDVLERPLTDEDIDMINYVEGLEERIDNAIDRLEALIIFEIKYNPIDHSMKVRDFEGVIEILKGSE